MAGNDPRWQGTRRDHIAAGIRGAIVAVLLVAVVFGLILLLR